MCRVGVRLTFSALLSVAMIADAQILCRLARPQAFDPDITTFTNFCYACVQTNIPQQNKALVFFPGTDAPPAAYVDVLVAAAQLGIQGIGLMYVNATSVNQLCSTSLQATCHEEIRWEIIDGTDRTPLVDVDRESSIENRLLKFLEYLGTGFTVASWGNYLDGTNIVWSNLIVAGHSQGANMAGFIAKQYEVNRCVMFQGLDWWYYTNQPASWVFEPGATPTERFFGFGHLLDPLATTGMLIETWNAYGLQAWGGAVDIDDLGPPYQGTHMFMSDREPALVQSTNDYHNATVVDFYTPTNAAGRPAYEPLWQYMMIGPPVLPEIQWTVTEDGLPAVAFETRYGYAYSVEVSEDLVAYVTNGPPVAGTGYVVTSQLNSASTPTHVRVMTLY